MAKVARTKSANTAVLSGIEESTEGQPNVLELEQNENKPPVNPIVAAAMAEIEENSFNPSDMFKKSNIPSSLNKANDDLDDFDEPAPLRTTPAPDQKKYKLHVTLKKITRNTFRLGLEKTEQNYQLVPGTAQTFVPFKKGNNFLTGLEDKPKVKRRLEEELGIDLSPSSKFYETLSYRMEDRQQGQLLVIEEGYGGAIMELIYYCMIASPIIANGLPEYSNGSKPEAEWYIENKEAEAEAEDKLISDEMEAYNLFTEMSPTRRRQLAKIVGITANGLSERVVKTNLWKFIKTPVSKNHGVNNIQKFLQEAKKPDSVIAVKALVRDAIDHNILRVNAARDYMYGEDNLGSTLEAVEEKLLSPRNIQLRTSINDKVELKSA